LLKSPAASAQPNESKASEAPPTWVNGWAPVPLSPLPVPYRTLIAPAESFSPGTPTARSANPSLSKSPPASEALSAADDGALYANAGLAPPATAARRNNRTSKADRRIAIIPWADNTARSVRQDMHCAKYPYQHEEDQIHILAHVAHPGGGAQQSRATLPHPTRPIRSRAAESQSATAVRNHGPGTPSLLTLAHETVRHRQEQRGTLPVGKRQGSLKAPIRSQKNTSERRSNDSKPSGALAMNHGDTELDNRA
jgi:hypothetical protein